MGLTFYKYKLPFKKPLITGKQTFRYRQGYIIEYCSDGFRGYGETAPLPGFSKETLKEVAESLNKHKKEVTEIFQSPTPIDLFNSFYEKHNLAPSLQFGFDSIAYQLEAEQNDCYLNDFLFTKPTDNIPVNYLLSIDNDNCLEQIYQLKSLGFTTLKLKVGVDFDGEYEAIKQIRSAFPDLRIRLDANQSWSLEEALRHSEKLSNLNIQYCEEPISEVSIKNFETLSRNTDLRIAIDESLYQLEDWPKLLPHTSYMVLKPMSMGSFKKNIETKQLANTHENEMVLTSSLESGIGRTITALLASGLGTKDLAQGLSTGHLLKKDIFSDADFITNGSYHVYNQLQKLTIDTTQLEVQ